MQHSTRLWSQIWFAIRASRAAAPQSSPPREIIDILSLRDGEVLCATGEMIRFARREIELLQILTAHIDHFIPWQEVARKLFGIAGEQKDEAALIRLYAHTIRHKIDGKCTFGIEGRQGYGYRLFGRLLIDD